MTAIDILASARDETLRQLAKAREAVLAATAEVEYLEAEFKDLDQALGDLSARP